MKPQIKLLWATPDAEYQIIRSARICYASEDLSDSRWVPTEHAQNILMNNKMTLGVPMVRVELGPNDKRLLETLMSNQHNTCLRFASAAFNISSISRACSHQLVRVAHFGILQRSQRYCSEKETDFIFPEETDKFNEFSQRAKELYIEAIESGMDKEDARYILPNATSTNINMVSNFQGWKHMLSLRLNKHAQYETRLVAIELCKQLYEIAPIIFKPDMNKISEQRLGDKECL